jgi:hypothetical protein
MEFLAHVTGFKKAIFIKEIPVHTGIDQRNDQTCQAPFVGLSRDNRFAQFFAIKEIRRDAQGKEN